MGVTKPNLLLLFVQQDRKSLEESTSLKQPMFWQFSAKNPWKKYARNRTFIKTHCYKDRAVFVPIQVLGIILRHAERAKF